MGIPVRSQLRSARAITFFDYDDTVHNADQLRRLFLARQSANENNLLYRDQYKEQYDNQYNTKGRQISVGDYVYVVTPPMAKHPNPKLHPSYEGPFQVHHVSEHTVEVLIRNRRRTFAKNNVKLAEQGHIRPPSRNPTRSLPYSGPSYIELPGHDEDLSSQVSHGLGQTAPPISSSVPPPILPLRPPTSAAAPSDPSPSTSSGDPPPSGASQGLPLEPLAGDQVDPFNLTDMEAMLDPQTSLYPSLSDTALLADDDVSMAEMAEPDTDVHMQSLLDRPLDATMPATETQATGAQGGARPRTNLPTFATSKRKAKSPAKSKAKKTSLADQLFGRPAASHLPGLLNPPSLRQLRSNTEVQDHPLPQVPLERKTYTRSKSAPRGVAEAYFLFSRFYLSHVSHPHITSDCSLMAPNLPYLSNHYTIVSIQVIYPFCPLPCHYIIINVT